MTHRCGQKIAQRDDGARASDFRSSIPHVGRKPACFASVTCLSMIRSPSLLTALLSCPLAIFAVDAPLTFKDPKPQRYELTARASELDPRVQAHPEIDFPIEKGGKPADIENAAVDTRVKPQGKLVIWLMGLSPQLSERLNSYGLDVIRPYYASGWFGMFGNAAPADDDKFLGKIRLEAAT